MGSKILTAYCCYADVDENGWNRPVAQSLMAGGFGLPLGGLDCQDLLGMPGLISTSTIVVGPIIIADRLEPCLSPAEGDATTIENTAVRRPYFNGHSLLLFSLICENYRSDSYFARVWSWSYLFLLSWNAVCRPERLSTCIPLLQ